MHTQTKFLKDALRKHGIVNRDGKVPSVTTERKKIDGGYEFGDAVANAVYLSDEEVQALKNESEYIRIYNSSRFGFSVIRY